jgi:hypothetical protein
LSYFMMKAGSWPVTAQPVTAWHPHARHSYSNSTKPQIKQQAAPCSGHVLCDITRRHHRTPL